MPDDMDLSNKKLDLLTLLYQHIESVPSRLVLSEMAPKRRFQTDLMRHLT
jgi:hypothetical protein